jgi:orotidine-5'-phosphate decarboxylase
MSDKYDARAEAVRSLLCVGLDTDIGSLPEAYQRETLPQFGFNRNIIEQTHEYAAAYKLNAAFYERRGEQGLRELRLTMEYLRGEHPDLFTICDAKRGDIGSTNEAYAAAIFDGMGFDAVTLHPYVGREALMPFLSRRDRVSIILCRTSNPGAGELQDLKVGEKTLWQVIAEKVSQEWNANENCMLVVGATYPAELLRVREMVGDMTLLVPGIGAQGGDVQAAVTAGLNRAGRGMIVNSSRGILWSDDPGAAARALRDAINACRANWLGKH